jgi:alpha-beta hydrolase superfamily lysophospholipase
MRTRLQLIMVLAALLLGSGLVFCNGLLATPAHAQTTLTTGHCGEQGALNSRVSHGELPSGALYLICVPARGWNGDLVVYAHGYTPVTAPLGFQNLVLADGSYLPDLVLGRRYAFATTSYRQNGLAILEGADDIRELAAQFQQVTRQTPAHTYLTGVSEGGLITTLLIEQSEQPPTQYKFSGGLAACGPIGSFRRQINYVGDFRVLFDYFFPGVLPGSAIDPDGVSAKWESTYVPKIERALADRPLATAQLMTTFIKSSGAPIDLLNPATWKPATVNLLWYNVFATDDARQKLGGNPFDNHKRVYTGSANDGLLNRKVERFGAEKIALKRLVPYETSGHVTLPLVTIHTTGDEITPYWHEQRYLAKVQTSGEGRVTAIPTVRYGHCNFESKEVLAAFNLLVRQVNGT